MNRNAPPCIQRHLSALNGLCFKALPSNEIEPIISLADARRRSSSNQLSATVSFVTLRSGHGSFRSMMKCWPSGVIS